MYLLYYFILNFITFITCSKLKNKNLREKSTLFSQQPFMLHNFNPSKDALKYLTESRQQNEHVFVYMSQFTLSFRKEIYGKKFGNNNIKTF